MDNENMCQGPIMGEKSEKDEKMTLDERRMEGNKCSVKMRMHKGGDTYDTSIGIICH